MVSGDTTMSCKTTTDCEPKWNCYNWSTCSAGKRTRTCWDSFQCNGSDDPDAPITVGTCTADGAWLDAEIEYGNKLYSFTFDNALVGESFILKWASAKMKNCYFGAYPPVYPNTATSVSTSGTKWITITKSVFDIYTITCFDANNKQYSDRVFVDSR
jgi:hypothetical protein